MADIDLERKTGPKVWPWIAALVVLALVIWGVTEAVDTNGDVAEVEPVEEVGPVSPAGPEPAAGAMVLGDILANPGAYVGETFPGTEVQVAEVPTDRGFWIEQDGQRLFALIIDVPEEEPKDINPGQTLRIEGGTLRDATHLGELEGRPLDADTRRIAEQQEIFLVVDERRIEILEGGEPQPGTDPAQSVGGNP